MDGNLEPLEKIFQHLEEESQRRAEELSRLETKVPALGDTPERPASALAVKRLREKRRGSISISRIGQLAEDEVAEFDTQGPTTPLPLMKIASDSPFYQAQIARKNDSTDSIASGASAHSDDHAHAEDDNHVTQMHHIAGKQSISAKMLPRRLSRSHSASVIPSRGVQNIEPTVIIDVSVQEATVESYTDDGPVVVRSRRTSIKAAGTLRHQSSMASIPAPKLPSPNWLAKAKKFTLKFTRRNRPSISVEQYES